MGRKPRSGPFRQVKSSCCTWSPPSTLSGGPNSGLPDPYPCLNALSAGIGEGHAVFRWKDAPDEDHGKCRLARVDVGFMAYGALT